MRVISIVLAIFSVCASHGSANLEISQSAGELKVETEGTFSALGKPEIQLNFINSNPEIVVSVTAYFGDNESASLTANLLTSQNKLVRIPLVHSSAKLKALVVTFDTAIQRPIITRWATSIPVEFTQTDEAQVETIEYGLANVGLHGVHAFVKCDQAQNTTPHIKVGPSKMATVQFSRSLRCN